MRLKANPFICKGLEKPVKISKISVVLPCYNEEKRILNTLRQIKEFVKGRKEEFEVIVVNDGSTDDTPEIVKGFDKSIKIVEYGRNMGKGYAIKKGMLESTGDITLFMDADASADIKELDRFIPYLREGYEVVVGSRTLEKDSIVVKEKLLRRFVGFLSHKLIATVIKSDVKDLLCAFKVYDKKAKEAIFRKQISNGMASDYEAIFLAQKLGFKVKELPIKWEHKEGGTAKPSWYTKALKELLMVRINNLFGKYE